MIFQDDFPNFISKQLSKGLPGYDGYYRLASNPEASFHFKRQSYEGKNPRICAVLILLNLKENSLHFPVIKRTDKGVHGGQISFPGGGRETQDKDLTDTALRETHEEIGVQVPRQNIIGSLSDIYIPVSNSLVTPYIAYSEGTHVYAPQEHEVVHVIEARIPDLFHEHNIGKKEFTFKDMLITSPTYRLGDSVIWGATAMILSELRSVLQAQ